jgi:hypothetical protein
MIQLPDFLTCVAAHASQWGDFASGAAVVYASPSVAEAVWLGMSAWVVVLRPALVMV